MWKSPDAKEWTGRFLKYRTSRGLLCVFFAPLPPPVMPSLSVPRRPKLVAPKE